MNEHISRENVFEHWPLDETGNRLMGKEDGAPTVKELRLAKVNLSGIKELEDFLRQEPLTALMPQASAAATPTLQEMIIKAAVEIGDRRRIGTAEFNRAVKTLGGLSYLLYLSLRSNQPEVTPRVAMKIYSDCAALKRENLLTQALFTVTGFTDDNSGNAPADKPLVP